MKKAESVRLILEPQDLTTVKTILNTQVPDYTVWAFGSRVSGTPKPWSDLDLAIISEHPIPLLRRFYLNDAFAESNLPITVDTVDWALATDDFKKIIQQAYVVLQAAPASA